MLLRKKKTEVRALGRHISVSADKVRRVIDQIRGRSYEETLMILELMPCKACYLVFKIVYSAAANASYTMGSAEDNLVLPPSHYMRLIFHFGLSHFMCLISFLGLKYVVLINLHYLNIPFTPLFILQTKLLKYRAEKLWDAYNGTKVVIIKAEVNEGTTVKKLKPRARGRSYAIKKATCHITIVVKDISLDEYEDISFYSLKKPRWKKTTLVDRDVYNSEVV